MNVCLEDFSENITGKGAGHGLYYYNARWYDANTGRFISEDPIRAGQNWFIYVSNNPMGLVDPSGLIEVESHDQHNRTSGNDRSQGTWNENYYDPETDTIRVHQEAAIDRPREFSRDYNVSDDFSGVAYRAEGVSGSFVFSGAYEGGSAAYYENGTKVDEKDFTSASFGINFNAGLEGFTVVGNIPGVTFEDFEGSGGAITVSGSLPQAPIFGGALGFAITGNDDLGSEVYSSIGYSILPIDVNFALTNTEFK